MYAAGPSKSGHIPRWGDLDQNVEPGYRNDDPADRSTPQKIGTSEFAYRKAYLHQSWAAMSLVNELLGSDPMRRIKERTSVYWLRHLQRRIIALAKGILAKNVAANSGDMLIKIASESKAGQSASTKFNLDAFIDAVFTMGDLAGSFVGIGCHSATVAQMAKNDDLETVRDSDGNVITRTYKGLQVIMDDSMPVRAGSTDGFVYTSVLFGAGVFGLGTAPADMPVEVERDPSAGHGGGQDILHERKNWLLHPTGHNWIEGTLAEFSPTLADLQSATHWARVDPRKLVPMAFIEHN
jgi:hypothetical protein